VRENTRTKNRKEKGRINPPFMTEASANRNWEPKGTVRESQGVAHALEPRVGKEEMLKGKEAPGMEVQKRLARGKFNIIFEKKGSLREKRGVL